MWQCWFKSECQVDVTGNIYTQGHYHKLRDNHHNKFIFTDFLGCLLAMKLDGAHCDTTTAPSDIIGVPKEPACHEDHKKSRFSDLAVIGTVKLSFFTASTRSGSSQKCNIRSNTFGFLASWEYVSKGPRKALFIPWLFPKSQPKKWCELRVLIIITKTSNLAYLLFPIITEMFLLTLEKKCF